MRGDSFDEPASGNMTVTKRTRKLTGRQDQQRKEAVGGIILGFTCRMRIAVGCKICFSCMYGRDTRASRTRNRGAITGAAKRDMVVHDKGSLRTPVCLLITMGI
jgi:hypothetical protein